MSALAGVPQKMHAVVVCCVLAKQQSKTPTTSSLVSQISFSNIRITLAQAGISACTLYSRLFNICFAGYT